MKFVRNLDICGHAVAVYFVTDAEMRVENKTEDDTPTPEGVTQIVFSKILLLEGLSEARTLDTYVHEIWHYFLDASGVEECVSGMIKASAKDSWEEQFIRLVTPWGLQFLTNNVRPLQLFSFRLGAV